jgi:hypothetical protein
LFADKIKMSWFTASPQNILSYTGNRESNVRAWDGQPDEHGLADVSESVKPNLSLSRWRIVDDILK